MPSDQEGLARFRITVAASTEPSTHSIQAGSGTLAFTLTARAVGANTANGESVLVAPQTCPVGGLAGTGSRSQAVPP